MNEEAPGSPTGPAGAVGAASPFDAARSVADAVLYEGYVLYPYRASSRKNQSRWQFGVLMPPSYVEADASERSACQTEIVFEPKAASVLRVQLRFLHVAHRTGGDLPEWDETVERELEFTVPVVGPLRDATHAQPFSFRGATTVDDAGVRRQTCDVDGVITVAVTEVPGPFGALRLTSRVENRTAVEPAGPAGPAGPAAAAEPAAAAAEPGQREQPADRDTALRHALVAAHSMYALDAGSFLSMTDPPEWARPAVEACDNVGTWPVLAGSDSVVLCSPIILGDHPEIAPESPGDLYDATEIDEILTLRTMALTDAEKIEARATDPRSAAVIDHVDALPQEHLDRLHGALRYLRQVTGDEGPQTIKTPTADSPAGLTMPDGEPGGLTMPDGEPGGLTMPGGEPAAVMTPGTPWWDPGADGSVSPDSDAIVIDGVRVSRGSRVRLRPGARRTDAQDLFLSGRTATVEAVFFDVDGEQHLGVTPDDDAELAEIQRWHGRFLYFAPYEVEPIPEERPAHP